MEINFAICVCLVSTVLSQQPVQNILVPYVWRNIDYNFPSAADRASAIQSGAYVPENVVLNDVDAWKDPVRGRETGGRRIFISTPRVRSGIPAALSTVTAIRSGDSFFVSPFPNWRAHDYNTSCDGIVTIDKMHIDRCGLLWAIDTGRINEFSSPVRVCQPKIIIYDLKNNDVEVERYEVPEGVVRAGSSLTTTVTESTASDCRDSIAYIADLNGNGLVVFDWPNRNSWRVDHNYFYPYPNYGTYTIAGVSFDLMDGIFGMALGPANRVSGRTLYFHSLASVRESSVLTADLRNRQLLTQTDTMRSRFSLSPEFREGQCSLEVITEDGIMIYSLLPQTALACWNIATPASRANTQIIYQDVRTLQFVSGLKLKGDELWIATNQVQTQFGGVSNSTEPRFRLIFIQSVRKLLEGTKCLTPTVPRIGAKPGLPTKKQSVHRDI